jgi:hypothetical protein
MEFEQFETCFVFLNANIKAEHLAAFNSSQPSYQVDKSNELNRTIVFQDKNGRYVVYGVDILLTRACVVTDPTYHSAEHVKEHMQVIARYLVGTIKKITPSYDVANSFRFKLEVYVPSTMIIAIQVSPTVTLTENPATTSMTSLRKNTPVSAKRHTLNFTFDVNWNLMPAQAAAAAPLPAPFAAPSLFAFPSFSQAPPQQPQQPQQPQMQAPSIFGQQQPTTGFFGNQQQLQPTPTTGFFGNQQQQSQQLPTPTTGFFGNQQQQQPTTSIFGNQQQQSQQLPNPFGAKPAATPFGAKPFGY